MTYSVTINGQFGEYNFNEDDLPLSIGVGNDVAIELPGTAEQGVFGYLGYADKTPFIQPAGRIPVYKNQQIIKESSWLLHGDYLRIGGAELVCEVNSHQLKIVIQQSSTSDDPPLIVPPSTPVNREHSSVTVPFSRPKTKPALKRKLALGLLSFLFLLLIVIAAYVFTARSVSVQITPTPMDIELSGGLLKFNVAGRYLLRPGDYLIKAKKEGFRSLQEIIKVDNRAAQLFEFSMQPLPGILRLAIQPEVDTKVSIDGIGIDTKLQESIELAAGKHTLEIQSQRYLIFKKDLLVEGAGKTQVLEVALIPGWGEISIDSNPTGAAILVDEKALAITPATVEIAEGNHRVQVKKEGFETWQIDLTVRANQAQSLAKIELKKADGKLIITSTPSSASVSVNGVYRGLTPLHISVSSDTVHNIDISKSGHESANRSMTTEATVEKQVKFKLIPKLGTVTFNIQPAGAQLFVDGKRVNPRHGKIRLSAVLHRLEIKKSGYKTYRDTITPRVGFTHEVNVQLNRSNNAGAGTAAILITTPGGQRLRYVGPGAFTMGASRREQGRRSNESLHTVELTKPYYISVKEVTNGEFRRFEANHNSGYVQKYSLDERDQPVVQVTWNDAARYCNWLSKKASLPPVYVENGNKMVATQPIARGYRLPTEAEWAWAARYSGNNTKLKYPWGNSFPPQGPAGNYADTTASTLLGTTLINYNDKYPTTAPAGSFNPNSLGLYDLGGNVAEWVHNYYTIQSKSTSDVVKNPSGPASGTHHTIRGSSWRHGTITELRLSYRDYSQKKRQDLGFRIAKYPN